MRHHAWMAQQTTSQTPRQRWNHMLHQQELLLAWSMELGRSIHQGMHHLPIEQEPYAPPQNSDVLNHISAKCQTILTGHHGPNHRSPQQQGPQRNTNHCRSWMPPRCHIPTLHNNHHQPSNHKTISWSHLLMVQTPQKGYQWLRSPLHCTLQSSPHKRIGDLSKPVNHISPSNRWHLQVQESMGRTIPATHNSEPNRLEWLAGSSHISTQQLGKYNNWFPSKPTTCGMGTTTNTGTRSKIK